MNSDNTIRPPKWADRFFMWYCRNDLTESILGDLHERYEFYRSEYSKIRSNYLYWMDILRFINRHTLKRTSTRRTFIPTIMLKNYTLVAFRNIRKNMAFTMINVIGLSISMAVCLLILATIDDQMSYDEFHSQRDGIYRVTHKRLNDVNLPFATTPLPLADKLKSEYVGLEQLVQFRRGFSGEIIDNGKAININGLYTNPEVFDLFDFPLELGNSATALNEPNTVVLRKDIAEKFFKDQDPVGRNITIEGLGHYEITGVLKEIPGKTHIRFEALASLSTVESLEKQRKLDQCYD